MAFSLFALVGPLVRTIFPPVLIANYFDSIVNDVVLYIWPTTVLGVGQGIGIQTHVALVVSNVLFFAVVGGLIGLLAIRAWIALMLYVVTCCTIILVEAVGFRSSLGLDSWCALLITFLLYAVPFGAVTYLLWSGRVGNPSAKIT